MPSTAVVGLSSGCFTPAQYRLAVLANQAHLGNAVEIACAEAARLPELYLAIPALDLGGFERITLHAPPLRTDAERQAAERLAAFELPLVVHADRMRDRDVWRAMGSLVLVENSADPERFGDAVDLLDDVFGALPAASFCFDVSHAFGVGGLGLVDSLARRYGDRMAQVNVGSTDVAPTDAELAHAVFDVVGRSVPIIVERPASTAWSQRLSENVRELRQVAQSFPENRG